MSSFHLQIVTPDGLFFDGEALSLDVRTPNGGVTILPSRHAPKCKPKSYIPLSSCTKW